MVCDMTKPYTERDLSDIFDADLIWRRKELSDMKAAIRAADLSAKSALLRALIAMSYAHWEGYVRTCANRYFEHLTLRRKLYSEFERQIYVNAFLVRLDALHQDRASLEARSKLINEILDGTGGRFGYVNPSLIDTKSNLNTDVIKDICIICSIDSSHFERQRTFIDVLVLKRRNAIAHGQQEYIQVNEIDDLVSNVLALMSHFRGLLENKVYLKQYAA
jgi:RiboL-PSP-HEPN